MSSARTPQSVSPLQSIPEVSPVKTSEGTVPTVRNTISRKFIGTRVRKAMGVRMDGVIIEAFNWRDSTDGTYKSPSAEEVPVQWDDGTKGYANKAWLQPLASEPVILSFSQAVLPLVSLTRDIAIQSGHGRIFYHRTERNRDGTALRCRVTGKCKVWKTRPHDYRLPVKHGLKNSFYLTHRNSDVWLLTDPTGVQGELPIERRKVQVQGYGYYGLDRRSGK